MKDYMEAQNLLKPCLDRINSLQGNFTHIETLRIFYLVLHISCSCFGLGQVNSASAIERRHSSKQRIVSSARLDQIVEKCLDPTPAEYSKPSQPSRRRYDSSLAYSVSVLLLTIVSEAYAMTNPLEQFTWLSRDHLNVLVYLVCSSRCLILGLIGRV